MSITFLTPYPCASLGWYRCGKLPASTFANSASLRKVERLSSSWICNAMAYSSSAEEGSDSKALDLPFASDIVVGANGAMLPLLLGTPTTPSPSTSMMSIRMCIELGLTLLLRFEFSLIVEPELDKV
ncbi:hypothetical protein AMATHDRAFT_48104 [Amanita thiersii Skay4041]|uniref:Uncharacterized protein n=1 Tax=Amanita thiersii Skay4041 TaxID=703135 RepID=A0A2A9NR60_9AGAR|nr:hypothetical protein AMATHDRAFT_48104 [Amanita thiersii Skay4041]